MHFQRRDQTFQIFALEPQPVKFDPKWPDFDRLWLETENFKSLTPSLKVHVLGQNRLKNRSRHLRKSATNQKRLFRDHLRCLKICLHMPVTAKIANLRGLYIFYSPCVWAENWYGRSLGHGKALTKISAQTDRAQKIYSPLKMAILAFFRKSAKNDFLQNVVKKGISDVFPIF